MHARTISILSATVAGIIVGASLGANRRRKLQRDLDELKDRYYAQFWELVGLRVKRQMDDRKIDELRGGHTAIAVDVVRRPGQPGALQV